MVYFRDRIRSTSSVVSHTFCTAVVYSLCKKDLDDIDEKHRRADTAHVSLSMDDDDIELEVEGGKIKMTNGRITNNSEPSECETAETELNV